MAFPSSCATRQVSSAQDVQFLPQNQAGSSARSKRNLFKASNHHLRQSARICKAQASCTDDQFARKDQIKWSKACANAAAAAVILSTPISAAHATEVQRLDPVFDGAKVIAAGKQDELNRQLRDFEGETGWKVRVYTSNQIEAIEGANRTSSRTWDLDKKTVVILVDPSRRGNIISVAYLGDDVVQKLRRPFWLELQSRYGNIFYVRDEGEQSAVLAVLSTVLGCLGASDGCLVPPGLPIEQFYFTLLLSVAGGLVFGFASLLEPQGIVKSRWGWVLIFSPLWAILFINFGMAPVLVRTSEAWPILANTAGFAAAAYFINLSPMFKAKLRESDNTNL